jgi:hypothetical protein
MYLENDARRLDAGRRRAVKRAISRYSVSRLKSLRQIATNINSLNPYLTDCNRPDKSYAAPYFILVHFPTLALSHSIMRKVSFYHSRSLTHLQQNYTGYMRR